jgi:hypothetical protein
MADNFMAHAHSAPPLEPALAVEDLEAFFVALVSSAQSGLMVGPVEIFYRFYISYFNFCLNTPGQLVSTEMKAQRGMMLSQIDLFQKRGVFANVESNVIQRVKQDIQADGNFLLRMQRDERMLLLEFINGIKTAGPVSQKQELPQKLQTGCSLNEVHIITSPSTNLMTSKEVDELVQFREINDSRDQLSQLHKLYEEAMQCMQAAEQRKQEAVKRWQELEERSQKLAQRSDDLAQDAKKKQEHVEELKKTMYDKIQQLRQGRLTESRLSHAQSPYLMLAPINIPLPKKSTLNVTLKKLLLKEIDGYIDSRCYDEKNLRWGSRLFRNHDLTWAKIRLAINLRKAINQSENNENIITLLKRCYQDNRLEEAQCSKTYKIGDSDLARLISKFNNLFESPTKSHRFSLCS